MMLFLHPPKKNPWIFRDKIPNLTVACGFNLGVPIKSRTAMIVPQWAVTKNPGWLGYILTIRLDGMGLQEGPVFLWLSLLSCAMWWRVEPLHLMRGTQQINSRLDHWSCLHNDVGFNCCIDFLVEDGYQGCWFPNKLKSPSCYMYDPEYICVIIPRRNEISNVYHCSESFASRHLFCTMSPQGGGGLASWPYPQAQWWSHHCWYYQSHPDP